MMAGIGAHGIWRRYVADHTGIVIALRAYHDDHHAQNHVARVTLSEKPVVLITNATQYVGPAAIARLVRDGARVVAQDPAFADPAARDAFATSHKGIIATGAAEPAAIVDAALAAHGRLDTVISNDDAPAIRAPLEAADLDDFRAGLEAMMVRPFALAQAAVAPMKRQGGGRILLITSAAPLRGLTNYGMYAAARRRQRAHADARARARLVQHLGQCDRAELRCESVLFPAGSARQARGGRRAGRVLCDRRLRFCHRARRADRRRLGLRQDLLSPIAAKFETSGAQRTDHFLAGSKYCRLRAV